MDEVEKIIRPIVEGQIRGFIKEHPSILKGVDWYKPRIDKSETLVNSISKRIVRDLVCPTTRARLAEAFRGTCSAEASVVHGGIVAAVDSGSLGTSTERAASPKENTGD